MKKILNFLLLSLLFMSCNASALTVNSDGSVITHKGVYLSQDEYELLLTKYSNASIDIMPSYAVIDVINNIDKVYFDTTYSITTDKIDNLGNVIDTITISATEEEALAVIENDNLHVLNDGKLHDIFVEGIIPRVNNWYYSTTSKEVKLQYFYTDYGVNSRINVEANWFKTPKIKKYDVLGVRWNTSTSTSNIYDYDAAQVCNGGSVYYDINNTNLKKTNYGWGQSMNLINNGTLCELSMWIDMYGNAGETAYASYQHARNSNVTLAISKAYTFSSSGLGGVLYWSNSTYSNYYDGMDGVVDTLSSGQHWDFHS